MKNDRLAKITMNLHMKKTTSHIEKTTGFTLIEIIVALFIFAILAVIATTSLYNVLNARERVEANSQQFAEMQVAVVLMGRDISQSIDRPIINNFNEKQPAMLGKGTSVELTRSGFSNPFSLAKRSHLLRVAYAVKQGELIRETWRVLDQAPTTKPDTRVLMKGISSISFRYLAHNNQFYNSWPPGNETNENELPKAIQVTMTVKNWGQITRLWTIPATALWQKTQKTVAQP